MPWRRCPYDFSPAFTAVSVILYALRFTRGYTAVPPSRHIYTYIAPRFFPDNNNDSRPILGTDLVATVLIIILLIHRALLPSDPRRRMVIARRGYRSFV